MRIGVTARFQNSYFSGSLPQHACNIAKQLASMGHEVVLLKPQEDGDWFIDVKEQATHYPPRKEWKEGDRYDLLLEVVWNFPVEVRPRVADRVALFQHYPPMFHDIESSVYLFNTTKREFANVSEIWTWSHYDTQDYRYLEFLSGKPVHTIPYITNFSVIDSYCKEANVPTWQQTALSMDARVTGDVPPSMSWCARIVESNTSNSSHCLIPLNIVSEIRKQAPIRFSVHNGETVVKNGFFQSNVAKNLLIPDISGNFIPRIRLPDLCREKSAIIAHQRFRPMKGFLLDALYAGIPLIHNCDMLKGFGYKYELNQIREAVQGWMRMMSEYQAHTGYFSEKAAEVRRAALQSRFGLSVASDSLNTLLMKNPTMYNAPRMTIEEISGNSRDSRDEIRVAFCDMWDQFNPSCNFFLSLLTWAGKQTGFSVCVDSVQPNLVIYGPFGESHKKHHGVPKVFFTGENAPPKTGENTVLNIGYQYSTSPTYIRLPLWVLEINWFGEDPDQIRNPRPVSLESCMTQDPATLDAKSKFCAFVATNPKCQNRNAAFHALNQWRSVDSGGRLFCNLPGGPIPAGLGGGGGELAKVDFYKQYKYVIAYENESSPGYTTEKLFHAKVAGCVPIYWGDKFVDRDFDPKGFLNANTVSSPQELIQLVETLEKDPVAWRKMAEVPALSAHKRNWCERTMEEICKHVCRTVLSRECTFTEDAWKSETVSSAPATLKGLQDTLQTFQSKKRIVTAANAKFVDSAITLVESAKKQEPRTPIVVYVWNDVTEDQKVALKTAGADTVVVFPTGSNMGWSDFWDPQHFAWKLWLHVEEAKRADAGTLILYMDAGIDIVHPLTSVWNHIYSQDMCVFDDAEQTNERWCHPAFCSALQVSDAELKRNQIWAGCVGFKVGGKYFANVQERALEFAKTQRETIVGDKWKPYSKTCMGHRHDQSILSILTERAGVPRMPLRDIYCDKSRRAAENWGTPLYVHRGHPRYLVPAAPGIDDAYVINLPHRNDRLDGFKKNSHVKDFAYVWKGIDGRKLELTPEIARLFRDNDFKWKKSVMGCALSHLGLWEKLQKDPAAKSYLILEDDVRFQENWFIQWISSAKHIPTDADVIYLGGVLPPNKPAFPQIVEAVNPHFARVAMNSLFGGPSRRYFHFCNYSYILTKSGAEKLIHLVKQRGIFTSGDHMIVNHGTNLLNIYFTTPLMTECIQEEDPVYQKSDFNNFNRVDSFDSDIWNNVECFSQKEITDALAVDMKKIEIHVASEPLSDEEIKRLNEEHAKKQLDTMDTTATTTVTPLTKEQKLDLWNNFLRSVALRKSEEVAGHLKTVFAYWKSPALFEEDGNWFRIFEQLITTNHPEIGKHKESITDFVRSAGYRTHPLWTKVVETWNIQDAIAPESQPESQPEPQPQPQPQPEIAATPLTKEQKLDLWNNFLRSVALRKSEEVAGHLKTVFAYWKSPALFEEDGNWFRIFEQLITTNHPEIGKHKESITDFVRSAGYRTHPLWTKVVETWNIQDASAPVSSLSTPHTAAQIQTQSPITIHRLAGGDPETSYMELEWLSDMIQRPIVWKEVGLLHELINAPGTPVLVYQNPPGKSMTPILQFILDAFQKENKQMILLHLSDEFARDDIRVYDHPALKHVLRNYWRPSLNKEKVTVFPLGYAKERKATNPQNPSFAERDCVWSFVGSGDRPGRYQSLQDLSALTPNIQRIRPTWSSPATVNAPEYCEILRKTKFVPCMRGSAALESFRLYEALEHGAIPFYVPSESHQTSDEYREVFGSHPLIAVPSWKDAVDFLGKLSQRPEVLEKHRTDIQAWWSQQKAAFRAKIFACLKDC